MWLVVCRSNFVRVVQTYVEQRMLIVIMKLYNRLRRTRVFETAPHFVANSPCF